MSSLDVFHGLLMFAGAMVLLRAFWAGCSAINAWGARNGSGLDAWGVIYGLIMLILIGYRYLG